MIATLFVVFAFASSALGDCPVPPTVPGADIGKIAGRWYEIAGPTAHQISPNLTCITEDFTLRKDGNFNLTVLSTFQNGSKHVEYGLAGRTDAQNSLNLYPMGYKTPYLLTFYIADTDYDNYLAAYACYTDAGLSTIQGGLILSRTNTMSADKYAELIDLLVNKIGVSSDSVGPIVQRGCKYWPVLQ
ncbi:apolipoprotein D-like [Tetranychus urticae]|uniref:Lipocalin/cytosolic fatty-acid binding domain-containing protein n=1 Tax=Tetranychus urticae TaxID=32264 RepID=T1KHQ4_TETUR|nr:apolipoprotein D-like [Tetranychus urticae]